MAKENKSNDSSSSSSSSSHTTEKASAPLSSSKSEEVDSLEKENSKPPLSSPPPSQSPPASPSHSPPPSPSPSSPPPQPQATPPHSSPPSKFLSPSKGLPPSPSPPPPLLSPPPGITQSPPPPQSQYSPPAPLATSPPSPSSNPTPHSPSQNQPSSTKSTPPNSSGSRSRPTTAPSKSHAPSMSPPSNEYNTGQIVGFVLATAFVLAFMAVIFYFVLRRKKDKQGNVYGMPPPKKGDMHVEKPAQHHVNTGQIVFSYDKVVEITNRFSSENVIGEGGFGRVYKATMPDGRVGAVKLLKVGSGQGDREFRAEVDIISRIHHRHLVSLIGYSIVEEQRVLIYEYVPNGTLHHHLHESGKPVLDWPKRMKVAIGAAKGLAYLHEGCNPKIIHRDIKSANILLDNAYEAQVADFGLARLTDDANTHVSTRVMGTFGYMAPEYATSGKLTDRSDVFSFGVVLLELVTGRKPVDSTQPIGDESLVEWARPHLLRAIETGNFSDLVDPRLERQYVDSEMFRMIEAAAACVRHSAPKRPSMVQIARALDSEDQLHDLSNGVKYGQSIIYDSGQYNEDIMKFRRIANGNFSESDFDMYSTEYNSRDMPRSGSIPNFSRGDSEIGGAINADNMS